MSMKILIMKRFQLRSVLVCVLVTVQPLHAGIGSSSEKSGVQSLVDRGPTQSDTSKSGKLPTILRHARDREIYDLEDHLTSHPNDLQARDEQGRGILYYWFDPQPRREKLGRPFADEKAERKRFLMKHAQALLTREDVLTECEGNVVPYQSSGTRGNTWMHRVVKHCFTSAQHTSLLDKLIAWGMPIDCENRKGYSAFERASVAWIDATRDKPELHDDVCARIAYLVQKGADVNKRQYNVGMATQEIIRHSLKQGMPASFLQRLLDLGIKPEPHNLFAVRPTQYEHLKVLLHSGMSLPCDRVTCHVISTFSAQQLSSLRDNFPSLNFETSEGTPLSYAVETGDLERVKLLISWGAPVDDAYALLKATGLSNVHLVGYLLAKGASVGKSITRRMYVKGYEAEVGSSAYSLVSSWERCDWGETLVRALIMRARARKPLYDLSEAFPITRTANQEIPRISCGQSTVTIDTVSTFDELCFVASQLPEHKTHAHKQVVKKALALFEQGVPLEEGTAMHFLQLIKDVSYAEGKQIALCVLRMFPAQCKNILPYCEKYGGWHSDIACVIREWPEKDSQGVSLEACLNQAEPGTGETVLHTEYPLANLDVLKALISRGARYDLPNAAGLTAYDVVCDMYESCALASQRLGNRSSALSVFRLKELGLIKAYMEEYDNVRATAALAQA